MNAVEIEQAITDLADQPFDRENFPYAFLEAFGNKETTIKRLRAGASNKSDLGGVLQSSNIHILTCEEGDVPKALGALKASPATAKAKAKFILATDGVTLEAEDVASGETVACDYKDFPDHFGFFLPLAGITTVRQITENAFDIRATSRLNRLYVELLKDNPEWGSEARRHDMNHFMARLIFCFFAEDTDIITKRLFTDTVTQMSASDSSNTHDVISALFRAMSMKKDERERQGLPRWASAFPYVNGGLFSGNMDVPRFSRIARSYLLHIGNLDWTRINPDIFGSMIQAVTEDEERGALGMHYTSVPNILKVLNPLFLDDLRAKLKEAGENPRVLLNLRKRMARIRVFDPACGSGNFLVIAYKEMRAIEAKINKLRGEPTIKSEIPLTNFRGIELRDFPAQIARLALVIAEYQCDVLYRGERLALAEFLPLRSENWITCGNALRLDWLSICPPTGTGVKMHGDDLFATPLDQAEIDFENEGGETYLCGNPPYHGSTWQSSSQKDELQSVFQSRTNKWRSLDYVAAWVMKAADYGTRTNSSAAFVVTNSICQGQQVPILWPAVFATGHQIVFAHTSFTWTNLASHNAGVTVAIVGISRQVPQRRRLFAVDGDNTVERQAENINAYLAAGPNVIVNKETFPIASVPRMIFGNKAVDGGHLRMNRGAMDALGLTAQLQRKVIRRICGSSDFINGEPVYCLWIDESNLAEAKANTAINKRIESVRNVRLASPDEGAKQMATRAHQFREMRSAQSHSIVLPRITSGNREFLPVGIVDATTVLSSQSFALYDEPMWVIAIITSKLHIAWIGTVCGRTRTDFAYSNTLGWNTFPLPALTEKNKADLIRCAEDILLVREHHFPATIADLYDPVTMPDDLRQAHDRNDEVLERIYIGRRFKNDTERLEKLFELYTKMTSTTPAQGTAKAKRKRA